MPKKDGGVTPTMVKGVPSGFDRRVQPAAAVLHAPVRPDGRGRPGCGLRAPTSPACCSRAPPRAGAPVALLSMRLIGGLLYGVEGAGAAELAASAAFLLATGLVAGGVPADRAARIQPLVALRHD